MVIVGLVLLLLGLGAGAFAFWVATAGAIAATAAGTPALGIAWFGNMLAIAPLTLVLLGLASGLLSLLGLWVMIAAGQRKARAAKERRTLNKQQKRQEKELAETRSRLAETEAHRTDSGSSTVGRPVHDGDTYRPVEDVRDDRRGDTLR